MSPSLGSRENREFASEIKFLLTPELARLVQEWARGRLQPDPHAEGKFHDGYRITSLYFDTEQFDVFHRRGSFARSKYRIRRYGQSPVVFLERKLKNRGLLTKRRSMITLVELAGLDAGEPERGWPGCWFMQRLTARRLQPAVYTSYDRTARVAMTEFGPIRLTLDQNVRAFPVVEPAFDIPESGTPVVDDQVILELKYRYGIPALFKSLIEEFLLTPESVSKYRRAAKALGIVPETNEATEKNEKVICLNS